MGSLTSDKMSALGLISTNNGSQILILLNEYTILISQTTYALHRVQRTSCSNRLGDRVGPYTVHSFPFFPRLYSGHTRVLNCLRH